MDDGMDYFERLESETHKLYEIANEARSKGFDVELETEIPLAKDLAERVEGLVGPKGIAKRIKELEENMSREEVAFEIAAEIASQETTETGAKLEAQKQAFADQGLRTALAILTEGVVAAPLEGISGVKITNTIAKELCENKRTHLIKGFKWKGSENANGEAYLVVTDEGKIGYEFPQRKTLSVSCPWCQKALREKSTFYGCTGFPDCKFTVPKEWSKHVFTEEEIGQLTNGETIQIKNKEGYFSDIRLNMDGERTRIEYV